MLTMAEWGEGSMREGIRQGESLPLVEKVYYGLAPEFQYEDKHLLAVDR